MKYNKKGANDCVDHGDGTSSIMVFYKKLPVAILINTFDWPLLSKYRWYVFMPNKKSSTYYAGTVKHNKVIYMHALLLNTPKGMKSDHINRNGLDNTRNNLRIATDTQSMANRVVKRSKVGYIGVYESYPKRYSVKVSIDSKTIYLGTYDTVEEAAEVYDKKILQLRGDFAVFNFPEKKDQYIAEAQGE